MDNKELIQKLSDLVQLDIDAVHAYDQAIKNIEMPAIRTQLTRYRDDHHVHITQLSPEILALGGTPPEYSPDFKGFLITGFTALRSATGTEGALKAMQTNEKLTNKNYREATEWPVSGSLKAMLDKYLGDEKIHLEYIETALKDRLWDK